MCRTHPALLLATAGCALGLLAAPLAAHGGQYRGPSGVVPPSGGGSGGSGSGSGGASGPSSGGSGGGGTSSGGGGSSAPSTPGTPPGAAATAATGAAARGVPLDADQTRWQYWWEFNKDAHLALNQNLERGLVQAGSDDDLLGRSRDTLAVDRWRPTRKDVLERIVPALRRVLATEQQRDIVSGSMMALAKTTDGDPRDLELMRSRLKSHDQEIRETAALCLGVSRAPAALSELVGLLHDTPAGRELTGRAEVDYRTRAFAGYALGLVAHASAETATKQRAFEALAAMLAPDAKSDRNVQVAAINGIRILSPDLTVPEQAGLRDEAVRLLWDFYLSDFGPGAHWVQAHAPLAISRLLGRGASPLHEEVEAGLRQELLASRPRSGLVTQSAALALGYLAGPPEQDPRNRASSEALAHYLDKGIDRQTRHYCLLSLGRIGGNANRARLLRILDKGRQLERSWAALSLGFAVRAKGVEDAEVGEALRAALKDVKDPEIRAAFAVALGLTGYRQGADDLRALLRTFDHQDEFAGYLCIGLSLLQARSALPELRDLVERSVRRPDLLKQAAVALGRLGDIGVADILRGILLSRDNSVAKMGAIASALALIGDRRTIDPLIDVLEDADQQALSRAFAAVALGGMGDPRELPWNWPIAADINYRAAVETLTNDGAGILDIF